MCEKFHEIYYKKELNTLYAISFTDKVLLEIGLLSGFKYNLDFMNMDKYIAARISFMLQHPERNTWMNINGEYIHLTQDMRIFEEIESELDSNQILYELGEEWYLIDYDKNQDFPKAPEYPYIERIYDMH